MSGRTSYVPLFLVGSSLGILVYISDPYFYFDSESASNFLFNDMQHDPICKTSYIAFSGGRQQVGRDGTPPMALFKMMPWVVFLFGSYF